MVNEPSELVVALDAGHPSKPGRPGCVSPCGRIVEHEYTWVFVERLAKAVEAEPCMRAMKLRPGRNEPVTVPDRARVATAAGAHIVVSVHVDYGPDPEWHGATILHWPGNMRTRAIADVIAGSWPMQLRRSTRGIGASSDYPRARYVLGCYAQDAILVETGFASNPRDVESLLDKLMLRQMTGAIMQGLRWRLQMMQKDKP